MNEGHRRHGEVRRRSILGGLAAAALGAARPASAAPGEIKVGIIMPISGPWVRPGALWVKGAELAAAHINAQGGVKAADGATIRLVVFDAGDSPETAKNAAQRMVAQEPDLAAAAGAWLSAFTLPASEVTERARLPLVTGSAADLITTRGFKYVFRTVPTGAAWVEQLAPGIMATAELASGKAPGSAVLIADSTPAAANWAEIFRTRSLPKYGVKLVIDDTFTPPISDATALVQRVRRSRADLFLNIATNVPDAKLFVDKIAELGVTIPTVFVANAMASSEVPSLIAPGVLEGMMVAVNNWGTVNRQAIVDAFVKATGEPFMAQESSNAYADTWLIKEAVERAGGPDRDDREKVAQALRTIDLPMTEGAGSFYYGGRLKFDDAGNRIGAGMMLVQWQGGKPVIVYPPRWQGTPSRSGGSRGQRLERLGRGRWTTRWQCWSRPCSRPWPRASWSACSTA